MAKLDRIVECVPNVSEGRDPIVIAALLAAVRGVKDAYLVDAHTDADHNRTVLTLVGTPDGIGEAVLRVTRLAAESIDLRGHRGQHPRIGAADVIPFVPMWGVSMQECVELARSVASRIGGELEIPVFLYEAAATRPHRKNLEWIRRGGLAGLADRMGADPGWVPDFGPPALHPTAGAAAVCARQPLIAFNVNLATADVRVARDIAARVRTSSGGLPAVKAMGVHLASRDLVQVSMNLTNFEVTALDVAFEAVKRLAGERGVAVRSVELVGLAPRRSLQTATRPGVEELKALSAEKVLEDKVVEILVKAGVEVQELVSWTL